MRWLVGMFVLSACGRYGFGDELVVDAAGATDAIDTGPVANRVFTTSSRVAGDFGGAAAADLACGARATEAGLTGTFISLVASATADPTARLAGSRGWVRVDGRPVYDTVAQLMTAGAIYPSVLDEHGRRVDTCVWTGTNEDGSLGSATCAGWSTAVVGQSGMYGRSTGTTWTAIRVGFTDCSVPCAFMCLEIGKTIAVAPPAPSATGGRLLFASAAYWTGGSLASADAVCASEATTAGVPGTFRALLATNGQPAAARLANLTGPWRRGDGVLLTAGTLGAGPLEISPNIGADGIRIAVSASFSRAWIGAPDLTTPGDVNSTCNNWSASGGAGIGGELGETSADAFGNPQFGQNCGSTAYLYCAQE